jgi:hypothetical protein
MPNCKIMGVMLSNDLLWNSFWQQSSICVFVCLLLFFFLVHVVQWNNKIFNACPLNGCSRFTYLPQNSISTYLLQSKSFEDEIEKKPAIYFIFCKTVSIHICLHFVPHILGVNKIYILITCLLDWIFLFVFP